MFNLLLKKIADNVYIKKISTVIFACSDKLVSRISKIDISDELISHIRNIFVLIISYTTVSLFVYPEFKISVFLKEIFSLLCAYGAIFIWFIDKITTEVPFKVSVGVTACVAPVLFINNSFGVAFICLLLIVFLEFLIFEHIRGCKLFSNSIAVYVICENDQDAFYALNFSNEYKLLELIILSEPKERKIQWSSIKTVDDIGNRLRKINYVPFFPSPKRLMYFAKKSNPDNLAKLLEISSEYSIPLFKATQNVFNKQNVQSNLLGVSPVSFFDIESISISQQDKTNLNTAFKSKVVWICYDGRGSVLDLICAMSFVNSIDLTIFCESEKLAADAEQELRCKCQNKNYKIKIVDLNLLCMQSAKPDVLFYNLPIKSFHSSEDNLKEAVIRNVLDTSKLIQFAQSIKIPFVFLLSSSGALNANNWIGATQRLGELFAQFADSKSRKLHTKFRVIRIPDSATDQLSIFGKIFSSVLSNGYINIDFPDAELATVYYRKDILPPLLKTVTSTMKAYDVASCVYTIMPKSGIVLEDLIKDVCNIFCLRKDKDVQVVYNCKSEAMELDNFPNITEALEKTTIANVLCTKFLYIDPIVYESIWTVEQINSMTTRDLISSVFQNLSEKVKNRPTV